MLCTSLANIASRFNCAKNFLELNEFWIPVLHKNMLYCNSTSVIPFLNAIHHVYLVLRSVADSGLQTGKFIIHS